jgi:hypothetical protein
MASLIDFVNRVRTLQDLPKLPGVWVTDTESDNDERCIVASALGVPVSTSRSPGREEEWVMRFTDRLLARRVGIVMGLSWRPDPPEVALPDALIDLCVAEHFGFIEVGEIGFLKCWWVPQGPDDTDLIPLAPTDELVGDGDWHLREGR